LREGFRLLKWIDIPPTWLLGALLLAWGLDRLVPGLGFDLGWMRMLGDGLVLMGLAVMGVGLFELLSHRTTFIPRRKPMAFARGGIYRITRNPIYLGDALVLAGAILHWDVLPALGLVPAFMALITWRFIRGEEAGLRAAFGPDAELWFGQVRRWL
jgi:protein-S-isoprenylcysteine O-methyltransferase Ste14